jgi:hypothetical protein
MFFFSWLPLHWKVLKAKKHKRQRQWTTNGFQHSSFIWFCRCICKTICEEDMMSSFIVYSLGLWGPVTGEIWLTQELPKQHAICHVLDDCGVWWKPVETGVQASSGWMVCRRVLSHSGPVWSMETGVWQQSKKPRSRISWMGWNCPPGVSLLGQ